MNKPLISIIVPCYNVEKYLSKCIESIINQTYNNLEILLIDDGSPDNSGDICDEYAKKDNRIKVIHKKNGGLSDARNVAIDIANGEYILFIDSDDYVAVNHVEFLFDMIYRTDSDIAIEDIEPFYEGTLPQIMTNKRYNEIVYNENEALINMFYQKKFDTCAYSKLYRKDLFSDIRFPKSWLYEDLATTYRIILHSKKVVFSGYRSYYYLLRKNSIEGAPFNPKKYESCINIINQLERDRKDMSIKVQKALDCRIVSFAFHILMEIPSKERDLRNNLFNIIRKKRKKVLFDKNARRKARVACLLSYFGLWSVDLLSNFGKSR